MPETAPGTDGASRFMADVTNRGGLGVEVLVAVALEAPINDTDGVVVGDGVNEVARSPSGGFVWVDASVLSRAPANGGVGEAVGEGDPVAVVSEAAVRIAKSTTNNDAMADPKDGRVPLRRTVTRTRGVARGSCASADGALTSAFPRFFASETTNNHA